MPPTPALAAILAAVLGMLTACSAPESSAADPDRPIYPLDDYLGRLQEAAAEKFDQELVRIEELIAECMLTQGFEYTPVPLAQPVTSPVGDLEYAWHTREFAEVYGYGLTTIDWTGGAPEVQDPNDATVAAMSEAEQQEYVTALYGDGAWVAADDEWFGSAGCAGAAQDQVWGTESSSQSIETLLEMVDDVMGTVQEEPEVVAAVDRWRACMTEAGHPGLTRAGSAYQMVADLQGTVSADVWATMDWEDEAAVAAIDDTVADRLAAEVSPVELEIALADWDCKAESGYAQAEYDATMRLQEEFVEAHRAELEGLVLEAGGKGE